MLKLIQILLKTAVRGYQIAISPLFPSSCRFYPTCSEYSLVALDKHGPFLGTWLTIKRIFRCHPGSAGGFDPVP